MKISFYMNFYKNFWFLSENIALECRKTNQITHWVRLTQSSLLSGLGDPSQVIYKKNSINFSKDFQKILSFLESAQH